VQAVPHRVDVLDVAVPGQREEAMSRALRNAEQMSLYFDLFHWSE
jgi:hypothetical protein